MSYEFIKLSEVEKIETPHNANLLIEENGEIKRLSTDNINFGGSGQQVQADWNETDDTSPAFIANKPSVNGEIVYFSISCGTLMTPEGNVLTKEHVKELWEAGTRMRVEATMYANGENGGADIVSIYFGPWSGADRAILNYIDPTSGQVNNFWLG